MRGLAATIGLLVALGGGYVVYTGYLTPASGGGVASVSPQQQIDTVGIKAALLTMGQAERQYFATRSTYATLADLQQDDLLPGGTDRRGYTFSDVVDGNQGFTITATPSASDKAGWPTLTIDQTLQVSSH